jgi:hypothetical protein
MLKYGFLKDWVLLTNNSFTRQVIFFGYRQFLLQNLCTMTTPTAWPDQSRTMLNVSSNVANGYIIFFPIKYLLILL